MPGLSLCPVLFLPSAFQSCQALFQGRPPDNLTQDTCQGIGLYLIILSKGTVEGGR